MYPCDPVLSTCINMDPLVSIYIHMYLFVFKLPNLEMSQGHFYIKQHLYVANTEPIQPQKGVLSGSTRKKFTVDR